MNVDHSLVLPLLWLVFTDLIAIKFHHFRRFVHDGTILINSIDTTEQIADIFTKPLPEKSFCYLREKLMGW